jgi:hypothetical protein
MSSCTHPADFLRTAGPPSFRRIGSTELPALPESTSDDARPQLDPGMLNRRGLSGGERLFQSPENPAVLPPHRVANRAPERFRRASEAQKATLFPSPATRLRRARVPAPAQVPGCCHDRYPQVVPMATYRVPEPCRASGRGDKRYSTTAGGDARAVDRQPDREGSG